MEWPTPCQVDSTALDGSLGAGSLGFIAMIEVHVPTPWPCIRVRPRSLRAPSDGLKVS